VVSRSVNDNHANNVKLGEILPPNCANTTGDAAQPPALPTMGPTHLSNGIVLGAGAQIINPAKADKIGQDNNFRGLTLFNNMLYYSKGSGSNGVHTVYFLDTTGSACPKGGRPAVQFGRSARFSSRL
jgi:hypothetical protein